MSYCKQEGKDRIIFVTKDDQDEPIQTKSVKDLGKEDEEEGLILPNGGINWNCPCLGGMASGPCGVEFREAFSCFHYSEADPKGSDCIDDFRTMQECMVQYPDLYPVGEDKEEMIEEVEEAGQDKQGEGVHHIGESKEPEASSESNKDAVVDEMSTLVLSEDDVITVESSTVEDDGDAVVKETTKASSENGEDADTLQEEGKS